jgi:serine/threonine protein kinase
MIDDEASAPLGYRLGGIWATTAFVGRGPVGEVYECTRPEVPGTLIAKLLPEELLESSEIWATYLAAVSAAAALESEAKVRHIAFGSDLQLGCPFVVTERVTWPSLAKCVAQTGPIAPKRWGKTLGALISLLERAHAAGVAHGRLTPANLFISPEAPAKIKVTDFGVGVACAARPGETLGGGVVGWVGPESEAKDAQPSPAGDVFSLGLLTFFALTGKPLFCAVGAKTIDEGQLRSQMSAPLRAASEVARKLGAELDPIFDKWFARTVVPSAADRYSSVKLLGEAFEHVLRRVHSGSMNAGSLKPATRAAATAPRPVPSGSFPKAAVSSTVLGTAKAAASTSKSPSAIASFAYRATPSARYTPASTATALALDPERKSPIPPQPEPASPVAVEPIVRPRAFAKSGMSLAGGSSAPKSRTTAESKASPTPAETSLTADPLDDQPTIRLSLDTLLARKQRAAELPAEPVAPVAEPEPVVAEPVAVAEPAPVVAEPVAAEPAPVPAESIAAEPAPVVAEPPPVVAEPPPVVVEPPPVVAEPPPVVVEPVVAVAAEPVAAAAEFAPVAEPAPVVGTPQLEAKQALEVRAKTPLFSRPKTAGVMALGLVLFGVLVGLALGSRQHQPEPVIAPGQPQAEVVKRSEPAVAQVHTQPAAPATEALPKAASIEVPRTVTAPVAGTASAPALVSAAAPAVVAAAAPALASAAAPAVVTASAPTPVSAAAPPQSTTVAHAAAAALTPPEVPTAHAAMAKTPPAADAAPKPEQSTAKPTTARAHKAPCGTFINPCK